MSRYEWRRDLLHMAQREDVQAQATMPAAQLLNAEVRIEANHKYGKAITALIACKYEPILFTASEDGSIREWSIEQSGLLLRVFVTTDELGVQREVAVRFIVLDEEKGLLYSGNDDGSVLMWDIALERGRRQLCAESTPTVVVKQLTGASNRKHPGIRHLVHWQAECLNMP